ncbi:MAG: CinA family protein [Bdellovibrionales bacterium]|jgi:nicotinamide-nucleotide amidase|nr:CinA family protein [Bdellovibrionales bacterium]MBT3525058.1 CinA family protein [Bdellovibrionales bacterium]MBT7767421.1 CinA family protein [Bdellovibrionales bacterium]
MSNEHSKIENLAKDVVGQAIKQRLTIATTESATGGAISNALTNIPGSSKIFAGGIICYRQEVKEGVMQIPSTLLEEQGAVSLEVTTSLVNNLANLIPSDLGVAITGVAGPDLDDHNNPVGTLFIAIRSHLAVKSYPLLLPSQERTQLKSGFTQKALEIMLAHLEELGRCNA